MEIWLPLLLSGLSLCYLLLQVVLLIALQFLLVDRALLNNLCLEKTTYAGQNPEDAFMKMNFVS